MNKFIYLFAILGSLALSTAQIVEPDLSNDGNAVLDAATVDVPSDENAEAGILTPFEDYLPVDGDSDYYKNGEDYGGIYEDYFENAEGFVSTADDINDDFGFVEDPIVAEEFVGLVDAPEPLNEEDATIGEAVVEPSEDPFQFNHIPNSALNSEVGEDFYGSWEAIIDSPDDIISEEGFVGLPDALIDFEEATVDVPEALIDLEEAVVGEPEALIDLEEGETGLPDDLVDFESGEADYPDDLIESAEDFAEALVDYPDNLVEAGEDVSEALVDYPDDLIESGEDDFSEALVDYPDDLFESEEVTVDIPEPFGGEVDEPEDITDAGEADEPEEITDAGEVDEPEDITDAGEADEPEDITDAGEVDEPEEPKEDDEDIGFAVDSKPVVELDPRVLDTNEEESTVESQGDSIEPDNVEQGDVLVAEGIDEIAAEPAEEESKNFLG